jgi:peptidylprolyl isomerase
LIVTVVIVAVLIVGYVMLNNTSSGEELPNSNKIRLETSMGDIVVELRDDMPITTTNFEKLVQQGVYDSTLFHRVVNIPQNLVMIQGGDPDTGSWSGGSITNISDEFSGNLENNKNERETIAMANAGPNTGSSQFFINGAYNSHLDNIHPVFGDVVEGMEVVDTILNVETSGEPFNQPLEDVTLLKAEIID